MSTDATAAKPLPGLVENDRPIIGRDEAWAAKLPRYFLGSDHPCKLGHISERFTRNGTCVACRALRLRAAAVEARAKGKKRPRKIDFTPEEWRKRQQAQRKIRRAQPSWQARNRRNVKLWRERHPEERALFQRIRVHRIRAAEGVFNRADIQRLLKLQRGFCAWCRVKLGKGYHVDHIQPISRGGSNHPRNLQLLCRPCNQKKHAKDPLVWAREQGRLL